MGSIASGIGSVLGGAVGSIVPGIGTSIGAGLGGALGGAIGGGSNSGGQSNSSVGGAIQNGFGTPAISRNPAWVNTAAQDIYGKASTAASQPYKAYTGQLVAPLTNNQTTASTLAGAAPGRYANTYAKAQGDLNNAANPYNQTFNPNNVNAPQNNQNITTNSWNAQAANQYMNPYIQSTLAPQLQDLRDNFAQQQNQLNGNAASAGAFGGSRQGLLNTQLAKQQDEQTNNLTNQVYSNAYNTGLGAYQSDQSRNLQGQTAQAGINQANNALNLQGQEFNGTQGLNAFNANYNVANGNRQAALNAAQGENNLVNTQQNASNSIINNLQSTGQTGQNTAQNQNTAAYQQYQNQLYYPEQQASYLNTLLKGNPATGSISSAGNNGIGNLLDSYSNSGIGSSIAGLFGGSSPSGGSGSNYGVTDANGNGNGNFYNPPSSFYTNLGSYF